MNDAHPRRGANPSLGGLNDLIPETLPSVLAQPEVFKFVQFAPWAGAMPDTRAYWLMPTVEAVTAVMCSAAPLEFRVRASCAALVDHAMASGAWLMGPEQDRMTILAAESEDEELHPIVSNPGLNELLMRRLRHVARQTARTHEPVICRRFDALGHCRDFVAVPLIFSGRIIGTLMCLFRSDLYRGDQELGAVEIIARIMAMALNAGRLVFSQPAQDAAHSEAVHGQGPGTLGQGPSSMPHVGIALRGISDTSDASDNFPSSETFTLSVGELGLGPSPHALGGGGPMAFHAATSESRGPSGEPGRGIASRKQPIDESARLEAIIRSMPGSMVVINKHGIATESLPGSLLSEPLPIKKAGNQGWLFNFLTDHAQQSHQVAIRKALRGESSSCQFQVGDWTGGPGGVQVIEQTFNPIRNETGEVVEVIGYAHNVTKQVTMGETLRQLREHDAVTDCMTMSALREQAEREIIEEGQHRIPLVFYTIEIEKSGAGIHLLGQSSFEELLQTVVARIRRQLPRLHILARRGDQSFVAVARLDDGLQAAAVSAEKIVQVLSDPIVTGRYEYFIATNVGYSMYPQDGGTLDEMFYNSDIAAMASERERRNMATAFMPSMASEANERVRIETALHRAVDHEEFELAYQPKVDLMTGDVTGVEALIRWPGRYNISPAKFIPIAEECGLISFIGEWALRRACECAKRWAADGNCIPVSVNVSTRQFQDSDFHDTVANILKETGCEPHLLELEVTEGVLMNDPLTAIACFNALKQLGVKISIDDFGTGFSSLSYLKNLPVDKLKIDRAFVIGLPGEKDNEAIVKAILAMANAMGLRTVAEGVEDFEGVKHLKTLGCHEIQGYYFSKPLFEADFLRWLDGYRSVQAPKATQMNDNETLGKRRYEAGLSTLVD